MRRYIAVREGVHKRIQAENHHEDKEGEATAEEMLEVPPEWNEVPDLMMEDEDIWPAYKGATKRKIDEVAWGRTIQQKKDKILPKKHAHSHTVFQRTQNSE